MTGLKTSTLNITVKKVSTDVFTVQSHTSSAVYEVNVKTGSCTCPHYKFRLAGYGGHCKHYNDVIKYLEEITANNSQLFTNIEEYVRQQNNSVEWNELSIQFGDDAIDEMLKLGMLYKQRGGRLGVLE